MGLPRLSFALGLVAQVWLSACAGEDGLRTEPDERSLPLRPDVADGGLPQPLYEPGRTVELYDSSAGHFRVHFVPTGSHAVPAPDADRSGTPDYVEETADEYERVLSFYRDQGFRLPLSDEAVSDGNGGDGRFDVYLLNFPTGADGSYRSELCLELPARGCAGYMLQENDFDGRGYTSLRDATRILASHELFHAVQSAYVSDVNVVLAEATAAWASELYDARLNDFEAFVPGYLARPERSLLQEPTGPPDVFSYGAALWFRQLEETYDAALVRKLWEELAQSDAAKTRWAEALARVLSRDYQSSLGAAFARFARWNLFTAGRADASRGYREGARYPLLSELAVALPFHDELLRLLPLSVHYVAAPSTGERVQLAASSSAEIDDVRLLLASERAGRIADIREAQAGEVLTLEGLTTGDRIHAALIDVRASGATLRVSMCLGTESALARCLPTVSSDAGVVPSAQAGGAPSDQADASVDAEASVDAHVAEPVQSDDASQPEESADGASPMVDVSAADATAQDAGATSAEEEREEPGLGSSAEAAPDDTQTERETSAVEARAHDSGCSVSRGAHGNVFWLLLALAWCSRRRRAEPRSLLEQNMTRVFFTLIALVTLVLPAGCSRDRVSHVDQGADPASADEDPSNPEGEGTDDVRDEPANDEPVADPDPDADSATQPADGEGAEARTDAEAPAAAADTQPDAAQTSEDAAVDPVAPANPDASLNDADATSAELDASGADAGSGPAAGGSDAAGDEDAAALDPACGDDQELLEPNGAFASLILLGATNFDSRSYYELNSCTGDVDHLLIGHLGGALNVKATGEVDLQVLPATVDQAATRAAYLRGDRRVITSASGPTLSSFESVPEGFYLLRVTGRTRARAIYSVNISHGCAGDAYDSPGVVDSSSFATVLTPRFLSLFDQPYTDAPPPESASLCAGDVDAFQFRLQKSGAAVIELGNATNIRASVTRLNSGSTESELSSVSESLSAGTRSLRITGLVPAATYVVRVTELSPSASAQPYTFRVRFEYDVTANDVCGTAQQLSVTTRETTLETDNIGTQSQVRSVCNGDAEIVDPLLAGRDVFFWFHLDAPASVSFDLEPIGEESSTGHFNGSATVYAAPGRVCPSSFDQLLPLAYDGKQAQNTQQIACTHGRLRIADVPAGDYLLVVDGSAGYAGHAFIEQPAQGRFRLSTQAFASAFPVPQACREATEITLPARGYYSSFRVSPGVEAAEAWVDYGVCTQYQSIRGGERIITFTASEAGTLTVRSAGTTGTVEAPFFDAVLAAAQGSCRFVNPQTFLACGDDSTQGLDSEISFPVRAGERYFLLVDHWYSAGDPLPAPTIVTFAMQ